jgi:TATA-box binding protein (TBP) (component of TFIID and TFIIIB)
MPEQDNYKDLTKAMSQLFKDLQEDKITIVKTNALTKVANVVVSNERNKIAATRIVGEDRPIFYEN